MLHIYKSIYCYVGGWIQFRCSEGKLNKYADYQDMVVVREFSDEGKSGKKVFHDGNCDSHNSAFGSRS